MTHTAASPHELGLQLSVHRTHLEEASARLDSLVTNLQAGEPDQHTVDHAEEILEWIADALRGTARLLDGVRPYTVTGAPREERRLAALRNVQVALLTD